MRRKAADALRGLDHPLLTPYLLLPPRGVGDLYHLPRDRWYGAVVIEPTKRSRRGGGAAAKRLARLIKQLVTPTTTIAIWGSH